MDAGDWIWVWIVAAGVLAVLELITPFLFFMISFATGAAVAAVVAAFDVSVELQWVTFVVVSAAALLVLIPLGRRLAHGRPPDESPEGATRWIGRTAIVLEEIPPGPHSTGLVRLERGRWRAETESERPIQPGSQVEVVAVRGTRLVVTPNSTD